MLRFFREKAAVIGWTIVIFFGATMFSGALYFGLGSSKPTRSQQPQSHFASLGENPINARHYNQVLQTALNYIAEEAGRVPPLELERAMLSALEASAQSEAYYIAAMEAGVEIDRSERKSMLKQFLLENDFKSKSELKKLLKKRGLPYDQFLDSLDREFIIRKFKNQMVQDIVINETLVDNTFRNFKFDTILIRNEMLDDAKMREISQGILSELNEQSVAEIQEKYQSIVTVTVSEGEEFYPYLGLVEDVRDSLVVAEVGEYMGPVCQPSICTIYSLREETVNPKPADFDEKAYSDQLQSTLREQRAKRVLSRVYSENPVSIQSVHLRAVYEKSMGDVGKALASYQELSSQFPSSSFPHFFRADLYQRLTLSDQVLDELEKGNLKSEMSPENDFPELHLFYGDVLVGNSEREKALEQYNRAFLLTQNDPRLLGLLRDRYEDLSYEKGVLEIDAQLAALEEARLAEEEAQLAVEELDESIQ